MNTTRLAALTALLVCSALTRTSLAESAVSFELEVQPILAARGCSGGACHGKARGQNGFKLSLLGFDADFDYAALTKHARGRRIFPAVPQESLLLRKATAAVPHGGGMRFQQGSDEYRTLLRWIAGGAPRRAAEEPRLESVEMTPSALVMKPDESAALRLTAHYSDDSVRDVTKWAMYQSNESTMVAVDANGLVRAGSLPGEATLMARYMNTIAACEVTIPLTGTVGDQYYADLPKNNFIDPLVWQKLARLGLTASAPENDATFSRRVFLDIAGTVPTPDEVRDFLEDPASDKRARLIDQLLDRPEYAEHWANKWADLLRPNPYRVGIKAVFNFDYWIRDSFRRNKPYDVFVHELVTASGSTWHNGAATMFRDRRTPDELATMFSQLFLGIRLECAKCHHHPFERWGQEDFYSFAAYFARVGRKGTGLSPPISGGEELILTSTRGEVRHPLTNEVLSPRPLFGDQVETNDADPREHLAAWMTSPKNDYFSEVMVNRVWADLMGRGLVEPIDDLRMTNPPSNGPLLKALGNHFREHDFDIKQLIRAITNSYVYALSTLPNERNVGDTRNYSRFYRRRLRAEVLYDAVCDITEVRDSFSAMPPGAQAKEIWTHRVGSLFLDTFGRPDPNQDPPCERLEESTVTQALHMMNSASIHAKVTSNDGRAARLAAGEMAPPQIVEELYLSVYARYPDEKELQLATELFDKSTDGRRQACEDLLWALLNTPEFLFKD
jgi:hypothetical protein